MQQESQMSEFSDSSDSNDSTNLTHWRGPDDPDCPYNWPMWKRIYMTSIPALLCVNVLVLFMFS